MSSWYTDLMSLISFVKVVQIFFCPILFVLFSWGSDFIHVRPLGIVPEISEVLFLFPFNLCPYILVCIISAVLFKSSLIFLNAVSGL